MFLKSNNSFFKSISFRLTFGYAVLFILSSFLILFLNYYLFNQSIKDRDHAILFSKAKEYSSIFSKGGIQELKSYLADQKQSDTDSQFLVRIESKNSEAIFLHIPEKMQQLSASEVDKKISGLVFSKGVSKFYMKENSVEDPDEAPCLMHWIAARAASRRPVEKRRGRARLGRRVSASRRGSG